MHGELFEPHVFVEKVKDQFGWNLSTDTVEYFIPKLRKMGWLESRSDFPARGPFYVNLVDHEFDQTQSDETRFDLNELGVAFRDFSISLSPINVLPDDPLEAGAILLSYVVDANAPLNEAVTVQKSDAEYLSARFISHMNKSKSPIKEILDRLSAVGFLFRVAEELSHPGKIRTINLKVVVDGPLILDYLGCSGDIRSEACSTVFDNLRSIGASTVTFSHCVDEARDALRSVLKANPRDRYGPTGEALRKGWVNENALLGLLQAFDVATRSKGIEILPDHTDFMPNSHQYFNKSRISDLEEIVNWHNEDNGNARYADVDTTVYTVRRRAGYRTSDLFDSKFVCVTTNDIFAGATKRHFQEISYYNSRQTPPVVSMKELSARLWIEVGNKNKNNQFDIPSSQLLLSCDRALRLNRKVVENARAELAKIKPEQVEQFELLLEVPRSARAVMDATLNNEKYVSGDTIEQLVAAAVDAAGEEAASKEKLKRTKDRQIFEKQLAKVTDDLEQQRLIIQNIENDKLSEIQIRRENDIIIIISLCKKASERYKSTKFYARIIAVFAVIVPSILIFNSLLTEEKGWLFFTINTLVFFIALAGAMDFPGAWLSNIIKRRYERLIFARLDEISRNDIANSLEISWNSESIVWNYGDF